MIPLLIITISILILVIVVREFAHLKAIHRERCNHAETVGRLRYYLEQNANKIVNNK